MVVWRITASHVQEALIYTVAIVVMKKLLAVPNLILPPSVSTQSSQISLPNLHVSFILNKLKVLFQKLLCSSLVTTVWLLFLRMSLGSLLNAETNCSSGKGPAKITALKSRPDPGQEKTYRT